MDIYVCFNDGRITILNDVDEDEFKIIKEAFLSRGRAILDLALIDFKSVRFVKEIEIN